MLFKKLDGYQQDAVIWGRDKEAVGLFFEQGTGKTWITGGYIENDWSPRFQALIVVPLTNKETTWLTFLRAMFPSECIFEDAEAFEEAPLPRVLVLHWEELSPKKKKGKNDWKFCKWLAAIDWSLIAFDEAHRMKNRTSLQSKAAARLNASARRKMILTGTPIEAKPLDLWAQMRFLAPDVLGTWDEFEEKYLEPLMSDAEQARFDKAKKGSFRWKMMLRKAMFKKNKRDMREEMMPEFLAAIEPYCLRVTKEVLDLLPLNIIPEPVRLYGKQRRIYDDLEGSMVAKLANGTKVTTNLRVTQLGKMQQVCGGYVFDNDNGVHEVGRAKLGRTLHLIRKHPLPIVVFCRYRFEVWAMEAELLKHGYRVEILTGRTKRKERAVVQRAFQAGKLDVLICQIKTGGVGIDLYRASVAIIFSMTYSSIDFDQAVSRLHRRGQTKAVNIFLLYAVGTIDEDICEAIRLKRTVIDRVLNRLKPRKGNGSKNRKEDEEGPARKSRVQVWSRQAGRRSENSAGLRSRRAA